MSTKPGEGPDRHLVVQGALWWNVERFANLHGYVLSDRGDGSLYLHRPGAPVVPPVVVAQQRRVVQAAELHKWTGWVLHRPDGPVIDSAELHSSIVVVQASEPGRDPDRVELNRYANIAIYTPAAQPEPGGGR